MTKTRYAKGQMIDMLSVAGEDLDVFRHGDIEAEVFTLSSCYLIPLITSSSPGSGGLSEFLDLLKQMLPDHPILFVNVINRRLAKRLQREGFGVIDEEAFQRLLHALRKGAKE